VPDPIAPAPYVVPLQFAPLRWYEKRGLSPYRWAEDQFRLEVRTAAGHEPSFESRCEQAVRVMDGLPLQVKDLFRGTIDQVSFEPATAFGIDTLGTWKDGRMRVNVDWAAMRPLNGHLSDALFAKRILQDTFIHEAGHALLEDPRGGIPVRSFVHLLAASGWLPHPIQDPTPFRWATSSPEMLTSHYLGRLQGLDPSWNPDLPLGSPGTPHRLQFDQDLMHAAPPAIFPLARRRGTLGLRPAARLGQELMATAVGGTLAGELTRVQLSVEEVQAAINRYQPPHLYGEELISETPAELFRILHSGQALALTASPALEAGDRLLVGPWRVAELTLGPREPARVPTRALGPAELTR